MKLINASLRVRNYPKAVFTTVEELWQGSLSTRKEIGSVFHCCGGLAKLVHLYVLEKV